MTNAAEIRPDRRQVLIATAGATSLAFVPAFDASDAATVADASAGGRLQPFDGAWRFRRGVGEGFEAPAFDDTLWRPVDLPHDWSIEDLPQPAAVGDTIIGPFDRKAEGGTAVGFAIGGEGWYRKRFSLRPPPGGRVEIAFDGVYEDSDVWLNGSLLGSHAYGYTPFAYDLTPYLAPSGDNLIAVRVRNLGKNSRWYSGSGIYRHVWLEVLAQPARIRRWGVGIATVRVDAGAAEMAIDVKLQDIAAGATIVSRIRNANGRVVWQQTTEASPFVQQTAQVASPRLWSPDAPTLYMLETELRHGAAVLDRRSTPFGIRVVAFDVSRGMTINGVPTKLRGGCVHHDNGLLGACAFDAAEDRKVALLKERGYNALRPSHNPFSPAFLDACDRYGMLVIAETFDAWRWPKLPDDYSKRFDADWRADLETIVTSARNHPSIVMWSIGNEIPDRNLPAGVELQWQLANEVHRLDPSRPVTAAVNDFAGRELVPSAKSARPGRGGVADQASFVFLDVAGYNYKVRIYDQDHAKYPHRVIYGSESFPKDMFQTWELAGRAPWMIGDFVWTAMDYLGEAGIGGSAYASSTNGMIGLGAWPAVNALCGDIDLIGRQKAQSLARDVVWGLSALEISVQKPPPTGKVEITRPWGWYDERRSWTWPDHVGKPILVRVYTAADRVELRLNGATVDAKQAASADRRPIEFILPYAPGTLEAVGFRGGTEIARRSLVTAGAPAMLRLTPERRTTGAGRGDVAFVGIEILDAAGRPVGDVERELVATVSGAELIGFGAAGPFATGSFKSGTAKTWDGHALAILRGTGKPGNARLEVRGIGITGGATRLRFL